MKIVANFKSTSDEEWQFSVPDDWTENDINDAFEDGTIWDRASELLGEWFDSQVLTEWEVVE